MNILLNKLQIFYKNIENYNTNYYKYYKKETIIKQNEQIIKLINNK